MIDAALSTWVLEFLAPLIRLFASPVSRLSAASLVAGIGFAALAYKLHYNGAGRIKFGAFWRFLFPARIYRHRSFFVDLKILLFSTLFSPAKLIVFGLSVGGAAAAFSALFVQAFGPAADTGPAAPWALSLLCLLLVLAYDFGTYLTHRLSHNVPLLWAFHRVHHSAEHLNPLTILRKHPVYDAVSILLDMMIVGPIQGYILYLWGAEQSFVLAASVNVAFGVFGFAASALRHSHVWLSFGPVLNRIFISPAMHQVHHSRAARHWDRNFGEVLSLWDWMFGSLYLPVHKEELEFGLGDSAGQPHTCFTDAMLEPFAFAARQLAWWKPGHRAGGTHTMRERP